MTALAVSTQISTPSGAIDVGAPGLAYSEMSKDWTLLEDLLGGTKLMRARAEGWLPREPLEDPQGYQLRLQRSFLFGAYADTIDRLSTKPFSKPVTVVGTLPEPLDTLQWDADNKGTPLTSFAKLVFRTGLVYGLSHILIDFPQSTAETKADEDGLRPFFVHVHPRNLLGWQFDDMGLAQVRIAERKIEPLGRWGDQFVDYIRVITRDEFALFKKLPNKPQTWQEIDRGPHTFGSVPLVTYYIERTGQLTANPPLERLAFMNLAHWQSSSDQRNILRFARSAILYATGITEEEVKTVRVGPTSIIRSVNKDAKFGYAEHSGKAIKAGADDIRTLEEQMEVLGMQPHIQRTAKSTATGKVLDESKTQSSIQAWLRDLEGAIVRGFEMAAQWMNKTLPNDFAVDVFSDFGLGLQGQTSLDQLLKSRKERQIDHKTYLTEVRRRGLLQDDTDIDAVIEAVEAEEEPEPEEIDEDEDGDNS